MGDHLIKAEDRARTLVLFPEWFGGDRIPETLKVPPEIRQRLREWNRTWESVLDPVIKVEWPDPAVGRAWIAEGNALVRELQAQLGSEIRVVGDFAAYDPDA
ncbi:hypothetical protein ABCS02_25985 [Microbacterium sp. X-17]|uniref:hypothetical protein n=1 Tax=Microbacterium sp. X-17 TaxID=3144404 RepID=UPI0031F4A2B3